MTSFQTFELIFFIKDRRCAKTTVFLKDLWLVSHFLGQEIDNILVSFFANLVGLSVELQLFVQGVKLTKTKDIGVQLKNMLFDQSESMWPFKPLFIYLGINEFVCQFLG